MALISSKTVYRTIQFVRQEPVFEKLRWLEATQWLDNEKLQQIQLERLKKILSCAFDNIPYYRKTLEPYRDLINHLRSMKQLEALPLLNKQQIRAYLASLQNPKFIGRTSIENTSGSTGDPIRFVLDRNGAAFMRAILYRMHHWYGIDIGEKEARFYGIPVDFKSKTREKFKDFLMNRKRFVVFDLSEATLWRYFHKINQYKPSYIYGYSSAVYEFAKFLQKNDLHFTSSFLKAIIVTSEKLFDEQRTLLESYFNVPVVNEYGCSEVGIIAAECPYHKLHISAENVVVEIISAGQQVPAGESGEIVVTGLNNFVMPFIRYKLGDVGRIEKEVCPCGRGLPILKDVEGRVNNMVITPEGKISNGMIFYYFSRSLIEKKGGIKKFKVVQTATDKITFHIVKDNNFNETDLQILEAKTHEYLSPNIKVNFEFFPELSHRNGGKIIHFISEIKSLTPYSSQPINQEGGTNE